MKKSLIGALAVTSTLLSPMMAMAQTEVHFWHAFTGRLGELVKGQVADFNASQKDYVVVESHKGNYSETLNAGIAAFRAKEQPHILMVFEVGTATMMAAGGAIKPVYEVMAGSGASFDPDAYIGAVKGYYTTTDGKMLSLPFNSSTPVLWVNRDAMSAAGVDP
ncbi:MAG: extracellular solute-binding protein, partial [Pseudomonadota bacterium]|nr:extracellular solute-binding protein [Pseudomonadota bacterium]